MAIKKSFVAIHAYLAENHPATLEDTNLVKLMEAKKGGFSGVDSFVTIGEQRVARICAMTGAVFAHDNTDKDLSFFYKNGSYMIGAEVVKANARKSWELDRETQEADLEDQMLEGTITPKEWKEATTELHKATFEFELEESMKEQLIDTFDGYPTKEAFTEAYNDGTVAPFTDYEDEIKALRDQAPQREEEA